MGAVDVLRGRISVDAQLDRSGRLAPSKSAAGPRAMAIPVWLAEELAALMAGPGWTATDPGALLFVPEGGGPLHDGNWRRRTWLPTCEKAAGLSGPIFQDPRSLATTALIAEGVDIKVEMKAVQTRIGHSSPQVTVRV